jgi:hypothetical protein
MARNKPSLPSKPTGIKPQLPTKTKTPRKKRLAGEAPPQRGRPSALNQNVIELCMLPVHWNAYLKNSNAESRDRKANGLLYRTLARESCRRFGYDYSNWHDPNAQPTPEGVSMDEAWGLPKTPEESLERQSFLEHVKLVCPFVLSVSVFTHFLPVDDQ